MTSSLVGSEMCIRDSTKEISTGLERFAHRQIENKWQSYATNVPPSTYPVSYTHLTLPTICSV
eukprot:9587053-Prorocentrum_lima.AAC.1